jgi:hypothetical protein
MAIMLYLALPTIFRRFKVTNYLVAWFCLALGLQAMLSSLDHTWWVVVYTMGLGTLLSVILIRRASKTLADGKEKIIGQFFFASPPAYVRIFLDDKQPGPDSDNK